MNNKPQFISIDESVKILKWLTKTKTKYLYLHMYDIQSPGYIELVKNLPESVEIIAIEFNLCRVREYISCYLDILEYLKLTKIQHFHLILAKITYDEYYLNKFSLKIVIDLIENTLLSGINSLLLNTNIKSLYVHDDLGRILDLIPNFFAKCIVNTNIRTLNLYECWLTSKQLGSLLDVINTSQIRCLPLRFEAYSKCRAYNYSSAPESGYWSADISDIVRFISALEYNQIERFNFGHALSNIVIYQQFFNILPKTCLKDLTININPTICTNDIVNSFRASLIKSKIQHLRFNAFYVKNLTFAQLFDLEFLKIKALTIHAYKIDNECGYQLLTRLTHIHLWCDEVTPSQFEKLMIHMTKCQIRCAMLRFPLLMSYWNIANTYLPKCKSLIEFGYDNGPFEKLIIENSPEENAFLSILKQSNIRYLWLDNYFFEFIIFKLRNTNITRIRTPSVPFKNQKNNIVDALINTQITHITVSWVSIFNGVLTDNKQIPNMSTFDCSINVLNILRENELRVIDLIANLDNVISYDDADGSFMFRNNCINQFDNILAILHEIPGMRGHLLEWIDKHLINIDLDVFENMLIDEYIIQISQNCNLDEALVFLRRIEERGQSNISQKLLYHRPAFLLKKNDNNSHDILHPYVYILLHKYNMIVYHKNIEPNKKQILIDYFTKHYKYDVESDQLIKILNLPEYL